MILETFIEQVNNSMVVHHTNLDTSKVDLKLMPGQRDFCSWYYWHRDGWWSSQGHKAEGGKG